MRELYIHKSVLKIIESKIFVEHLRIKTNRGFMKAKSLYPFLLINLDRKKPLSNLFLDKANGILSWSSYFLLILPSIQDARMP